MRRIISALFSLALLASLLTPIFTNKVYADDGEVENLGVPNYQVGIFNSSYGVTSDGTPVTYVASSGSPAVFNVINTATGERIASHPLDEASSVWGSVVDPSGIVYIAGSANLYRYDPEADELENLGRAVDSESSLWHVKSDEDGRIYGGTYPNAKIFMYDPETDAITDYGSMVDGEEYARSLDIYNGKIYVGVGINPHLIEFDPATGEKNEIAIPEENSEDGYPYDLDIVDDLMFARLSGSSSLLVYDLVEKTWIDEIPGVKGLTISDPDPDNKVYFNKENEIHSYDLNERVLAATGFINTWSNRGFDWIELDEPGFEGLNLTSMLYNGSYWIYNPSTGNSKDMQAQIEGQPIGIQSIAKGPDGNIYSSGYQAGGFSYYSPTEEQITSYTGFGQAENMLATDKYLYIGKYAGGDIYRWDPTEPYDHDPTAVENATNPKLLFSLGEYDQDRPFAFAAGDGNVFIGTVPDYGIIGGSLTILNEETEEHETIVNIVQDQSVIALQYKDGLVYGSTSIFGGLGSEPTAEEAKLFIFDPDTKEKVYESTPLPGEKAIGALEFDDEGYLWGMSPGKIFKFDPETREVIESEELFKHNWDATSHYWRGAFLDFDQDGNFYGTTKENLFKFNPDNWELEILDNNATLYAKDDQGNFYFSRGAELFKYDRKIVAPEIELNGDQVVYIEKGAVYTDLGVSVLNQDDSDIDVQTNGEVDANTAGTYSLQYVATNQAGRTVTLERTIHVINIKDITLNDVPSVVEKNNEHQFEVTPVYENDQVPSITNTPSYQSSDSSIATVTESGLVKFLENGKVTLTISYGDIEKSYNVTINEEETDPGNGDSDQKDKGSDKDKHDQDSEGKDADKNETDQDSDKGSNKELPDTSTNMFSWLLIGIVLLFSGTGFIFWNKRKVVK